MHGKADFLAVWEKMSSRLRLSYTGGFLWPDIGNYLWKADKRPKGLQDSAKYPSATELSCSHILMVPF